MKIVNKGMNLFRVNFEEILVHMRYEQKINHWHKIIDVYIYQIEYTKSYDILS